MALVPVVPRGEAASAFWGVFMFRTSAIFALTLATFATVYGQGSVPRSADQLRRFERLWLTAHLNADQNWLSRFSAGRLNVIPLDSARFNEERSEAVASVTTTNLPANEMKVRISGTISLLTNDPAQNRSFHFLDTFNKIGGKWQVIATSISPSPVRETSGTERIERELLQLENQIGRSGGASGASDLNRILAPDFVGTSANGRVQSRHEWIHARELAGAKSSVSSDLQVRLLSDDLAVVTGVETMTRAENNARNAHFRFTNTWAKRSGSWQCVAAHVSRIA